MQKERSILVIFKSIRLWERNIHLSRYPTHLQIPGSGFILERGRLSKHHNIRYL